MLTLHDRLGATREQIVAEAVAANAAYERARRQIADYEKLARVRLPYPQRLNFTANGRSSASRMRLKVERNAGNGSGLRLRPELGRSSPIS